MSTLNQKLTPFLWFDTQAEDAMNFYVSVFPDAKVVGVSRYGPGGPGTSGSVMTATFNILGQSFTALNGGPHFTFNPAISFVIHCDDQAEIDDYWDKLTTGGSIQQCGWLTDKFGISWQVVPDALPSLLSDPDPAKAGRAMKAMMGMKKLDIAALERAKDQELM